VVPIGDEARGGVSMLKKVQIKSAGFLAECETQQRNSEPERVVVETD